VKRPTQKGLQAETTVTEAWPLNRDGSVSSLICVELVAQAICALSTWRRGDGARPRVGLLVGIKEAEFSYSGIPWQPDCSFRLTSFTMLGPTRCSRAKSVRFGSLCKTIVQVMEPEEEALSNLYRLTEDRREGEWSL